MERKQVFCVKCNSFVDYIVQYEDVIQKVKDDEFTLNVGVPYCISGHHEVFVDEIDQKTQQMFFDAYREKYHLISINEIISIRKKIGLNQRDFSRLLGLGEISISRYELGSLPSQSISTLIMSSRNIDNLKEMYEKNKNMISEAGGSKIESYLAKHTNLIYTGNVAFNSPKLYELTYLLTREAYQNKETMYPTKMNKLLFYVDFMFFKLFRRSVTGTMYFKLQYGPVPRFSDFHYDMNELIIMESDDERRWMLPKTHDLKITKLDEKEKQVALSVYSFFTKHRAKDISEYSHKELAWMETELGKPISYAYADKIESIV